MTTIRLPDELRQRVDGLIAATGRSINYHLQRAVEDYMERRAWQVNRVTQALDQARSGKGAALGGYVEDSVADRTITRSGYQ